VNTLAFVLVDNNLGLYVSVIPVSLSDFPFFKTFLLSKRELLVFRVLMDVHSFRPISCLELLKLVDGRQNRLCSLDKHSLFMFPILTIELFPQCLALSKPRVIKFTDIIDLDKVVSRFPLELIEDFSCRLLEFALENVDEVGLDQVKGVFEPFLACFFV
jgi:hypothetical protein